MVAGLGVDEGGLNALELRRVVDLLNRELSGLLKLNLRFRRQGVGGMTSLIVAPMNWWRGHRWGVRIEPPGDEGIKLVTEAICYVRIFNDLGIETHGMPEESLGAHPTYLCQCKGYKFTKKTGKKHASFT
ncbi:hypothetical protein ACFXTH_001872 [Malus domestica]